MCKQAMIEKAKKLERQLLTDGFGVFYKYENINPQIHWEKREPARQTVCMIIDPGNNNRCHIGSTLCSIEDNFNKQEGRARSFLRAYKQLELNESDRMVLRNDNNRSLVFTKVLTIDKYVGGVFGRIYDKFVARQVEAERVNEVENEVA
jgi:hypothetical protein